MVPQQSIGTAAAVVLVAVLYVTVLSAQGTFPRTLSVKQAAMSLQSDLIYLLENTTSYNEVQKEYASSTQLIFHPLNGSEIVQNMADKLSKSFANKVAALKRLKFEAERAVREYKYNFSLKKEDVKYVNMKVVNKSNINLQYHPKFQQEVSFTNSGVHVPLDIYDGYPDVINGLKWSQRLDEAFKENNPEDDPQLSWQFFGSKSGFMRVYPANRWKSVKNAIDLYDVRRRPWYIQGSTSPKDMLILMDTSGSVQGQTLAIMKQSVKTLLNTLEENDYVNIAWFSNKVGWVSCFDRFVQANSWNKKVLSDGLSNLKVSGMSNYARALEFAFEIFRNFSVEKREYEGARCHKVIMMFTDGGTGKPEEVLKMFNKDKQIRIFTYAVGPHAVPINTVKWMACQGRGYFNTISAVGSIKSIIQQYPNVLMRPMALNNSQSETYSTVYTDAGGVGMVITVTLPVYNQSKDNSTPTTSVGVVGIDTPVTDIATLLPRYKTGPNSYIFAINHNGFILLHPKLKSQKNHLIDDQDIDFLDLESDVYQTQNSYFANLRKDMIDEKSGSQQFLIHMNSGDQNHVVLKNVTYYFTPIKDVPMSLGIVIPDDRKGYLSVSWVDTVSELEVDTENEGILIAPWEYCPGLQVMSNNSIFIKYLIEKLVKDNKTCNKEMIGRLSLDIKLTKAVTTAWPDNQKEGWSTIFIGTEGGVTRLSPKSEEPNLIKLRDPLKSDYFKKAILDYPTWTFMISDEFGRSNANSPVVVAVKPLSITVDGMTHKPAVFGVRLRDRAVVDLIKSYQTQIKGQTNNCEPLESYLLDEGGYIIASSNPEDNIRQVGTFLGEVDAHLMSALISNSIYKKRLEYDYPGTCYGTAAKFGAASKSQRIESFVTAIKNGLHLVTDALLWLVTSWPAEAAGDRNKYGQSTNCIQQGRAVYYLTHAASNPDSADKIEFNTLDKSDLDTDLIPSRGEMLCGNCSRKYVTVPLLKTNLLLVTVTHRRQCPFPWHDETESFTHKKDDYVIVGNVCDEERRLRYRRRPSTCYDFHPLEDYTECRACNLGPSRLFMTATTAFTFIIVRRMQFSVI